MHTRNNTTQRTGMLARMLRKHGFRREKHKDFWTRHTLGLGGLYVHTIEDGYKLVIRDIRIDAFVLCETVSELREHIEELDLKEAERSAEWKQKVKDFGKEKRNERRTL